MPHRLRFQDKPSTMYFVTDRCFQGRFLMRPSPKSNAIIIGVMAHAEARYDVQLHNHCFMSNHFHLLVTAPSAAELAAYMQYVKSNLARELGRLHGWKGKFWFPINPMRPRSNETAI